MSEPKGSNKSPIEVRLGANGGFQPSGTTRPGWS